MTRDKKRRQQVACSEADYSGSNAQWFNDSWQEEKTASTRLTQHTTPQQHCDSMTRDKKRRQQGPVSSIFGKRETGLIQWLVTRREDSKLLYSGAILWVVPDSMTRDKKRRQQVTLFRGNLMGCPRFNDSWQEEKTASFMSDNVWGPRVWLRFNDSWQEEKTASPQLVNARPQRACDSMTRDKKRRQQELFLPTVVYPNPKLIQWLVTRREDSKTNATWTAIS